MEVSNDLVLYIDGKPVVVCTGATLTPQEPKGYVSCLEPEGIRTFEVSGIGLPEPTALQEWQYHWYRSKVLPRKEKKAYRKKLLKLLA
jgi:hypothetical protein